MGYLAALGRFALAFVFVCGQFTWAVAAPGADWQNDEDIKAAMDSSENVEKFMKLVRSKFLNGTKSQAEWDKLLPKLKSEAVRLTAASKNEADLAKELKKAQKDFQVGDFKYKAPPDTPTEGTGVDKCHGAHCDDPTDNEPETRQAPAVRKLARDSRAIREGTKDEEGGDEPLAPADAPEHVAPPALPPAPGGGIHGGVSIQGDGGGLGGLGALFGGGGGGGLGASSNLMVGLAGALLGGIVGYKIGQGGGFGGQQQGYQGPFGYRYPPSMMSPAAFREVPGFGNGGARGYGGAPAFAPYMAGGQQFGGGGGLPYMYGGGGGGYQGYGAPAYGGGYGGGGYGAPAVLPYGGAGGGGGYGLGGSGYSFPRLPAIYPAGTYAPGVR